MSDNEPGNWLATERAQLDLIDRLARVSEAARGLHGVVVNYPVAKGESQWSSTRLHEPVESLFQKSDANFIRTLIGERGARYLSMTPEQLADAVEAENRENPNPATRTKYTASEDGFFYASPSIVPGLRLELSAGGPGGLGGISADLRLSSPVQH